ncbi:hypothetical protein HG531_007103 [Fusarium graminearum]|nr:hypothetical protein HG531_007103 [Fusarium graminearum]
MGISETGSHTEGIIQHSVLLVAGTTNRAQVGTNETGQRLFAFELNELDSRCPVLRKVLLKVMFNLLKLDTLTMKLNLSILTSKVFEVATRDNGTINQKLSNATDRDKAIMISSIDYPSDTANSTANVGSLARLSDLTGRHKVAPDVNTLVSHGLAAQSQSLEGGNVQRVDQTGNCWRDVGQCHPVTTDGPGQVIEPLVF